MPMTTIGMKEMMGTRRSRFTTCNPIPRLKTSWETPKAANTDNKYPTVALMGTAMERNTKVSSTRHSPTTKIPKGNRAAPRRCETSSLMAVKPVTAVSTPYVSRH